MTILGDRIRERRKLLELNQTEFGKLVGLKQSTISELESGEALETTKLNEIALACGVTPAWLLGQTDDPQSNVAVATRPPAPQLMKLHGEISLPEIDLRGGAAYAGGISDQQWQAGDVGADKPVAHWGFPPSFVERELNLSYGHADVLMVYGDSMDDGTAQALVSGDRVIIDRKHNDVRQGGVFAVFDGDGVIIKQVELIRGHSPAKIICKSRNKNYDPIPLLLEDPVRIIGRVAGRISRV